MVKEQTREKIYVLVSQKKKKKKQGGWWRDGVGLWGRNKKKRRSVIGKMCVRERERNVIKKKENEIYVLYIFIYLFPKLLSTESFFCRFSFHLLSPSPLSYSHSYLPFILSSSLFVILWCCLLLLLCRKICFI